MFDAGSSSSSISPAIARAIAGPRKPPFAMKAAIAFWCSSSSIFLLQQTEHYFAVAMPSSSATKVTFEPCNREKLAIWTCLQPPDLLLDVLFGLLADCFDFVRQGDRRDLHWLCL